MRIFWLVCGEFVARDLAADFAGDEGHSAGAMWDCVGLRRMGEPWRRKEEAASS